MTHRPASLAPPAQNAMTALQIGFDGGPPPQDRHQLPLWRVGRWLRVQGAGRPTTLHRADDGLIVVNGQILMIDPYGDIRNLSTMRRQDVRASGAQGYRL